jgi:hypothetical protein
VTGVPYFFGGKPLIRGGKPAMAESCCCGEDECCCGPCLKFRFTIQGVTDGGTCADCADVNGTYITGEIAPNIVDGVCTYETLIIPLPNPLAACEDAAFELVAKITCPVDGQIRLEASVQIGIILLPPVGPGDPPVSPDPHFLLDTLYDGDCFNIDEEIPRTLTLSNICGLTGATATIAVLPCVNPLAYIDPASVPYESPMGENYIAPSTASVGGSCRNTRHLGTIRVRQPKQTGCRHRGQLIGAADCGCAGKPKVYHCTLLGKPCTPKSAGKPIVRIVDGPRIESPMPCSICEHYQPIDSTSIT